MNPADLLDKASKAVASAKLLLNAGDTDGACNRAYYAMFDAARGGRSSGPVRRSNRPWRKPIAV